MKKIFLILITLLFCSSCYNYQEVNEIAIVDGIGIDYQNNEYKITFEIVDINSEYEHSYTIESIANNFDSAINNTKELSSKEISLSHLETVIISKNLNIDQIIDIGNYFINSNDVTTNFYLVTSDNASNILNNKNDINSINTKNISDMLDVEKDIKYQFDYIISSILNDKDTTIPYISLEDNNIKIDKEGYKYEK